MFFYAFFSPCFFDDTHIIFRHLIRDGYVSSLFSSIEALSGSGALSDVLEGRGAVHLLMAHLVRNHSLRELKGSLYAKHISKLEKVNQVITYIHENYKKPLSTAYLAKEFYMSEGYFCQLFREVMQQSAITYLNSVRMEKAEHLLKSSDMPVSQIALCCGFSDANYFSRTYKKEKGETPTQARLGG